MRKDRDFVLPLQWCSLFQRSNELPSSSSSETGSPAEPEKLCDLDDEICLSDHPDYPLTQIRQGLTRHGTLDDKKAFSSLVSLATQPYRVTHQVRP